MYLYIYDSCLKEKKYQNLLSKIENKIIDLDIKGKILRLNMLKNIYGTLGETEKFREIKAKIEALEP